MVNTAEYVMLETEKQEDDQQHDWFESLELGETADNSYVLDFTESDMEIYSKFLDFMKLIVPPIQNSKSSSDHAGQTVDDEDDDEDDVKLYVVAYGFK